MGSPRPPVILRPNELNVNPIVDIPITRDYSTVSVKLLDHGNGLNENGALDFDANKGDIDLDPPKNEAFGYLINKSWYRKLRGIFLVSTRPRIHGPLFRSEYGVYQERARHLASHPWIIHPFSTFRWFWDIFISLTLVLVLLAQPILITFYHQVLRANSLVMTLTTVQGTIFFIDLVLSFRTGVVSKHNDTVILDSRSVAWHYLQTWFIIDFVSTIPYDAILEWLDNYFAWADERDSDKNAIFKNMRLLELLKIFRLPRLLRYLTRFQEAYLIDSIYIRVINLHIVMLLTLHWNSCLHYLIAHLFNPRGKRKEFSWVSMANLWDAPVWKKYINAMIRALSNMACLGYGTDVPKSSEDIICTIFSIMVGATFFALFIGNLSSILINVDVSQKKYVEVLNQVMEYMRFKQIPKDLQNRVILYYEHRYHRNYFNENSILYSVSDVLRQEIQMFNCRRLVEAVPLFNGLPITIVQNIVGRLQFEVYLPHDVIIGANTIGDCMYFIEHGTVCVLAPNGKTVARLRDGDFFGELALITNERRNATVMATAYCDAYRLEREDFEDCIVGYPEVYKQLIKVAEERAGKITTTATEAPKQSDEASENKAMNSASSDLTDKKKKKKGKDGW